VTRAILPAETPAMSESPRILMERYEVTDQDLDRVRAYGRIVGPKIDEFVRLFYDWLARQPEFHEHFQDPERLERVKSMQVTYWAEFLRGKVDEAYVRQREKVGEVHARIGLPLPVYFAAMNTSLEILTHRLYDGSLGHDVFGATLRSMTRLLHLDTAIVVDTYSRLTNKKFAEQSRALMEMSTPVTAIWQGILLLPVVGLIDSRRAKDVMNAMLAKISETRARIFILDISGVAVVDTAVANHLIKITKATRLMGCDCILSGISAAIAQTVVELGIDVGGIRTTATLRDALEDAFRRTGVELRQRGAGSGGAAPAAPLAGGVA
jgi:rsbT co-antagonist protein RsbR